MERVSIVFCSLVCFNGLVYLGLQTQNSGETSLSSGKSVMGAKSSCSLGKPGLSSKIEMFFLFLINTFCLSPRIICSCQRNMASAKEFHFLSFFILCIFYIMYLDPFISLSLPTYSPPLHSPKINQTLRKTF